MAGLSQLVLACASPAIPPGGPVDTRAPVLLQVVPESGAVNLTPRAVIFRFDEVVNERPAGAQRLDDMFMISPRGRGLDVSWDRESIWLRPNGGWRKNAVYTVTMRPGMSDLRGNVLREGKVVVFATGPVIPDTRIDGRLFDWVKGTVAVNTLVEAIDRADTTIAYVAMTDSSGAFELRNLPPGGYVVRASVAAGGGGSAAARLFDRRRAWDSVGVALADSAVVELLAFVHDTLGPRIGTLTIRDSVTLRLLLDQPLALDQGLTREQFTLVGRDSLRLAIDSVFTAAEFAAWEKAEAVAAARRDSIARRDTTTRPDSLGRAPPRGAPLGVRVDSATPRAPVSAAARRAADSAATADSIRRAAPKPSKPIPVTEVVVRLGTPLVAQSAYRLSARDLRGLLGRSRPAERVFSTPRVAARDSSRAPGPAGAPQVPGSKPPPGFTPSAPPPTRPPR
ncbi:MAG: Ig-like domain-containing protein [Gemmatimonadetes bacterium]|nr:Ig-like domain-containing protein [Gemmatimonadota bacterium]